MKKTLRLFGAISVFLMLCGFSSTQFDSRGYATNISVQDRMRVDEILEYRSEAIVKRMNESRESGQKIGIGILNEAGEVVYRVPQN